MKKQWETMKGHRITLKNLENTDVEFLGNTVLGDGF